MSEFDRRIKNGRTFRIWEWQPFLYVMRTKTGVKVFETSFTFNVFARLPISDNMSSVLSMIA